MLYRRRRLRGAREPQRRAHFGGDRRSDVLQALLQLGVDGLEKFEALGDAPLRKSGKRRFRRRGRAIDVARVA